MGTLAEQFLVDVMCDELASHLQAFGEIGVGSRALLMQPWCQKLAGNPWENAQLSGALPLNMVAVQCTAFDKSPTRNWLVSLHQDLGIPVKHRWRTRSVRGGGRRKGKFTCSHPSA
jgi:hypothetical protein